MTVATLRLPCDGAPWERPATLGLVQALCSALSEESVEYCHWKSNEALDRSLTGDNDLDLLVARGDRAGFLEVLARLGFKAAELPRAREVPAVRHYYGLDRRSGRLVHVHAHFRLVLGDDTTKNFWLPIESAYLASCSHEQLLPVPAPAYELAVLVLRLVLKHATWDAQLQRRGTLSASEQRELAWLLRRTDWQRTGDVVAEHVPFVAGAWPECRRALEPDSSPLERIRAAARLERALHTFARRSRAQDASLRVARRLGRSVRSRLVRRPVRKHLAGRGAVVALVGGDGAGKSTAVEGLVGWLSGAFAVEGVHLGRPRRSWTTWGVTGIMAMSRRTGLLSAPAAHRLLGHACTARDRRLAYTRARRLASRGGVAVCDRYPVPQLRSMDGPRGAALLDGVPSGRIATTLARYEARQYSVFTKPDLLAVLRVDPEVAVERKTGERSDYVRRRSTEVWHATWDESALVVDAARSPADVLADLRVAVWDRL